MNDATLLYAQAELERGVIALSGSRPSIGLAVDPARWSLADATLDDAWAAEVVAGQGTLVGSNPRAVLLGVYDLLRRWGCAFLRPGPLGEVFPRRARAELSASYSLVASRRHRGLCMEGSLSLEHVLALIDWMPKAGFNAYFVQFREGYNFFERWYGQPFDVEQCRALIPPLVEALKLRGMLYHAVGHGFTCEAYGVPGLGWMETKTPWPEEHRGALALRGTTRELVGEAPLITALCYSHPAVQERITEEGARYAGDHPEIDYLHFWLDDGNGNKCQCENCTATRLADQYFEILNLLDAKLTERGLSTRVAFLAYHELLWPPQTQTLRNPARFTFMFAPIQRTTAQPLPTFAEAAELPVPGALAEYRVVEPLFPKTNADLVAHLQAWNAVWKGDRFDFDYYLWHANDASQVEPAKVIFDDLRRQDALGLNGLINCQPNRLFAGTGVALWVMGRALTDGEARFDDLVDEWNQAAFGTGVDTNPLVILRSHAIRDFFERAVALRHRVDAANGADKQAAWDELQAFTATHEAEFALEFDRFCFLEKTAKTMKELRQRGTL
ncbi:MAG: hypothetical protein WCG80_14100 [Spirochaetales bacterium]